MHASECRYERNSFLSLISNQQRTKKKAYKVIRSYLSLSPSWIISLITYAGSRITEGMGRQWQCQDSSMDVALLQSQAGRLRVKYLGWSKSNRDLWELEQWWQPLGELSEISKVILISPVPPASPPTHSPTASSHNGNHLFWWGPNFLLEPHLNQNNIQGVRAEESLWRTRAGNKSWVI